MQQVIFGASSHQPPSSYTLKSEFVSPQLEQMLQELATPTFAGVGELVHNTIDVNCFLDSNKMHVANASRYSILWNSTKARFWSLLKKFLITSRTVRQKDELTRFTWVPSDNKSGQWMPTSVQVHGTHTEFSSNLSGQKISVVIYVNPWLRKFDHVTSEIFQTDQNVLETVQPIFNSLQHVRHYHKLFGLCLSYLPVIICPSLEYEKFHGHTV